MKKIIFSFLILSIVILGLFKVNFYDQDFYFDQFKKNKVYENFQTNSFELSKTWFQTINYLSSSEKEFNLTLNDKQILTDNEKSHMNDVRILIQSSFATLNLLFLLFIAFVLLNINDFKKKNNYFYHAGLTLMIFSSLIVLFSFINFDVVFNIFHEMLFTGNYAFPTTSKLLMLFPAQFFLSFAIRIFGFSFLIGLIITLLSGKLKLPSLPLKF